MSDAHGLDYRLLFEIFNFLFNGVIAAYCWVSSKNKATNGRIDRMVEEHKAIFDAHADRLARLEEGADSLPTHRDLGEIHTRINEMGGDVSQVVGEMKGIRHTLNLIQEHLIKGGSR
ncbi:DUF2730 family protein [Burkholderia cenocepacia]|uniref:DUF2730 family protein n=1 Tax=Burkholderia cenocepacia TaxID=95486 RepID=UPI001AA134C1|nr:DUF2730 family protein [Burkholderia cenocepacia]MBO1856815.1 DUF2730 family protein [Burkholderia cenocepacia]